MPKIGVLGAAVPGHGKHAPKLGVKLDAAGLHLHRHSHHHGHHGAARPKEPAEAEASRRVQSSFAWGPELHGHAAKPRSHLESLGTPLNTGDSLAYRWVSAAARTWGQARAVLTSSRVGVGSRPEAVCPVDPVPGSTPDSPVTVLKLRSAPEAALNPCARAS